MKDILIGAIYNAKSVRSDIPSNYVFRVQILHPAGVNPFLREQTYHVKVVAYEPVARFSPHVGTTMDIEESRLISLVENKINARNVLTRLEE